MFKAPISFKSSFGICKLEFVVYLPLVSALGGAGSTLIILTTLSILRRGKRHRTEAQIIRGRIAFYAVSVSLLVLPESNFFPLFPFFAHSCSSLPKLGSRKGCEPYLPDFSSRCILAVCVDGGVLEGPILYVLYGVKRTSIRQFTSSLENIVLSKCGKDHIPSFMFNLNDEDNLNNRFKPIGDLQTDAIFSVDDAIIVSCSTLDFAFTLWQIAPSIMMGFVPQMHWLHKEFSGFISWIRVYITDFVAVSLYNSSLISLPEACDVLQTVVIRQDEQRITDSEQHTYEDSNAAGAVQVFSYKQEASKCQPGNSSSCSCQGACVYNSHNYWKSISGVAML
ncbi:Glycosyl transferase 64 domain [Dillenia turbinata]|uniref:Glycosyl transferase 64 domain n=1 Tax=Dillenia turbinata TaxID=194707 RepID=A0AAN8VR60_9MAGN